MTLACYRLLWILVLLISLILEIKEKSKRKSAKTLRRLSVSLRNKKRPTVRSSSLRIRSGPKSSTRLTKHRRFNSLFA